MQILAAIQSPPRALRAARALPHSVPRQRSATHRNPVADPVPVSDAVPVPLHVAVSVGEGDGVAEPVLVAEGVAVPWACPRA